MAKIFASTVACLLCALLQACSQLPPDFEITSISWEHDRSSSFTDQGACAFTFRSQNRESSFPQAVLAISQGVNRQSSKTQLLANIKYARVGYNPTAALFKWVRTSNTSDAHYLVVCADVGANGGYSVEIFKLTRGTCAQHPFFSAHCISGLLSTSPPLIILDESGNQIGLVTFPKNAPPDFLQCITYFTSESELLNPKTYPRSPIVSAASSQTAIADIQQNALGTHK